MEWEVSAPAVATAPRPLPRPVLRAMLGLAVLGLLPGAVWTSFGHLTPIVAAFKADRVVVLKGKREVLLMRGDRVRARLPAALGFAPVGHKQREGDGRTPEGTYTLDWRWNSPRHGPSIHVSYPAPRDRKRAQRRRVDPGGAIMIHRLPASLPWMTTPRGKRNWTEGCIGLKPRDMNLVWRTVADGTPIEIRP